MKNIVKQERKPAFIKKTLKAVIAFMLCAAAIITSISAGTGTVCAQGKKIPLKVGFNGVEIVLVKDINSGGREDTKIKTLKAKWGKPKKVEDNGTTAFYTWKKGKTSIEICNNTTKGYVGGITVNIKDKNGSLFGVKVGMKKSAVLKKLKKVAGSKNVVVAKEGQNFYFNDDGECIVEGEPTGDDEYICLASSVYMPVSFDLKNGKVKSISWFRS